MKLINLYLASSLLLLGFSAQAVVQPLLFSSDTPVPIVRWMFAPPEKSVIQKGALAALKQAQLQGKAQACLEQGSRAMQLPRGLQPWIATVELECVVKNVNQLKDKSPLTWLTRLLGEVERHGEWLSRGAQAARLRAAVIQGRLSLIDVQIKNDRAGAWDSIEKLIEIKNQLDSKQRALLYRQAGELSFIQQKMEASRQFILRSLAEAETPEAKERLASVESTLNLNMAKNIDLAPTITAKPASIVNPDLEASGEELNYVKLITNSLKTGELITAVEDSIRLIHDYPGGVRAKWATDRVLEIYLGLIDHAAGKNEDRYLPLTDQVLRLMEKVDSARLSEWSRVAYNHGQYENSLRLSKQAIKVMEPTAVNSRAFELAADSALALERYDEASKYYNVLINQYGGTTAARSALLHSGLINYRKGDYNATVTSLERLLALPQSENFEPVARYWLWRALQKSKSDHAGEAANTLIEKYPFSYYGLRASIEKNSAILSFANLFSNSSSGGVETTLWLTRPERAAYERIMVLLQSGWTDEAQVELQELPTPLTPVDRALRARLYAAALNYSTAINLVNKSWDEQNDLRREPFLSLDFPREFSAEIKAQALNRSLSPYLVMGLIKQESAYQIRAVSTSPAYGLMQMIGPTAKEIATDLKIQNLKVPDDLYNPLQNIKMGTYYFAKMLSRYDGNVPMALAAYNAGPSRFEKWLRGRPSLKELAKNHDPNPDQELWFDELPWSETSFYIKAILRNYLLYRVLDQGSQKISFPVWLSPLAQP